MNYEQWRNELFNTPPDVDPTTWGRSDEFHDVSPDLCFDFVDQTLVDAEVSSLFSKQQIGNGFYTIYSDLCGDLPYLYIRECSEERRIRGICNLINLYHNYFERYCAPTISGLGDSQIDGSLGFICYMLWDIFVLYPGNASPAMVSAAIEVMGKVLNSHNESCLASAIHGLGHWAEYVPEAAITLQRWLHRPTTEKAEILNYARVATTGRIM
jgi:hypothetical protein